MTVSLSNGDGPIGSATVFSRTLQCSQLVSLHAAITSKRFYQQNRNHYK